MNLKSQIVPFNITFASKILKITSYHDKKTTKTDTMTLTKFNVMIIKGRVQRG